MLELMKVGSKYNQKAENHKFVGNTLFFRFSVTFFEERWHIIVIIWYTSDVQPMKTSILSDESCLVRSCSCYQFSSVSIKENLFF